MSETEKNLVHIEKLVQTAESVAIGGHVHPDGDCAGAVIGLYHYIKKIRPELPIDLYLRKIPDAYAFLGEGLPIYDSIDETSVPVYDLFFCLDCASRERLTFSLPVFEAARRTVNIDHHISDPEFADINRIVPDASSTCELLFDEFDFALIDENIATALFIGISHDTGIFRYSCTSPKTFETAAQLLRKGIDASRLITKTYCERTLEQQRVMADAMLRAKLYVGGQMIASSVSVEQRHAFRAKPEYMDGIVEQLRDTSGVEFAAFLHESRPGYWKLSLRSDEGGDVRQIAAHFGGGGHVRAAGATVETDDPEQVFEQIAALVREQMETRMS